MDTFSSALTKPGQLREGFYYQDLYGMHLALSWLEHPVDFLWMRLEADEFGSLDDVVILRSDHTLSLNQIKHVTERPERPSLSLDHLLEKKSTRARSLFQKWFQSWLSVEADRIYKAIDAIIHTNRPPAEDLAALLVGGTTQKIAPSVFRVQAPTVFAEFVEQAGEDGSRLDDFFSAITFRFNSADIEPAEQVLRDRASRLNISAEGFSALLDQVWDWSTRHGENGKTVKISLEAIKRACGWRKVEKLNEAFPIAQDYVALGGGELLEAFGREVVSHDAGEFVLSDVPGAGKSTFLAKLADHLRLNDVPCIRHHYFLGGDDEATFIRLNARRTADALIAELEAFTEIGVNPSLDQLKSILTTASAELKKQGRKLVLLLDGLDHVLRTEEEDELALVLKQLLPPPPNLSVVFGTRLSLSARVRALLDHVPLENNYRVPRMIVDDCKTMLLAHPAIHVPDHAIDTVSARLADITEGLPLHAHYCMVQLEVHSQHGLVIEQVLDQLVPYGGDLGAYYDAIWRTFSPETKILAIVLALAEFPVPPAAMPALFNGSATDLQRAIESLQPFVNETHHGLTLFHASFQEFVADHAETAVYKSASLERLILWLRTQAHPDLQWRWLHAKEFEAGVSEPLISATDRDWVIDAIKAGQPTSAIEDLLRLACHAAMMRSDYGTALDRGMSADQLDYYTSTEDSRWSDAFSLAGLQRLDRVSGTPDFLDFRHENSDVLLEFAQRASAEVFPAISKELSERFETRAFAKLLNYHESATEGAAKYYVGVLALSRTPLQTVTSFIARFLREPARFAVSDDYIDALLSSGQFTNALTAVEAVPVTEVQRPLLREKLALVGISKRGIYTSSFAGGGLWGQLHHRLTLQGTEAPRYQWPEDSELPLRIERFKDDDRALLARAFHSAWINGLLAGVANDTASLRTWVAGVRSQGWTGKTASHLATMGFDMGETLARSDVDVCSALSRLNEVDVIEPGHPSWDDYELWISYKRALYEVLRDCLSLRFRWQQKLLDNAATAAVASIPAFEEHDQYKVLLSCDAAILSPKEIESFTGTRLESLKARAVEFPERAEAYLEIAILARRTELTQLSESCLRHAIDNLLGYGNHKDIYLYELLRSHELALKRNVAEIPGLLDRVAPVVNSIRRVTDGDETDHLVEEFAGITLQQGSSAIAAAMYQTMMEDERYYHADQVFAKIAELGDLSSIWIRSLLRTSIDSGSRHHIARRSAHDSFAAALINDMKAFDRDPVLGEANNDKPAAEASKPEHDLGLSESVAKTTKPEAVSPDLFIAFCTEHKQDHYTESFSERWWDHWAPKDRRAAYDCLTSAMEQRLIRSWSGNLELRVLSSVLEFEGRDQAFEALITAARNVHVWNSFYTQAEKTQTVFDFLLTNFPKRIDEFIRRTTESAGYRRRLSALPVRRGAQFLFEVGRPDQAVSLITSGVERLMRLMANLELSSVRWTQDQGNLLGALFTRLFHVHPEVRSRAAKSLGELLLNIDSAEAVRNEFGERLASCQLESELVTLLYPIAYALKRGYVWTRSDLEPLLKARSIASDMVIEEMYL